MQKITKIKIDIIEKNYCPFTIEYEDGSTSSPGGGNIYEAIVGILAELENSEYVKKKWDRMDMADRINISNTIKMAFKMCEENVEFFMNNFYEQNHG